MLGVLGETSHPEKLQARPVTVMVPRCGATPTPLGPTLSTRGGVPHPAMKPLPLAAAAVLCMPAWSSAEPFEVIVSAEIELLLTDSGEQAQPWAEQAQVPWGWLLPTADDTFPGRALKRVRLTHQSNDPAVSFHTELLTDPSHIYRPNEAIGDVHADPVMLAALAPSDVRPTKSKARWNASVRVPASWEGECLLTTTVQFGDDEAHFTTRIRISRREPEYTVHGLIKPRPAAVRVLKAQRVRSSTSGDSEIVDTVDLTWRPPDSELRANRQELEYLRIHDLDRRNIRWELWETNWYQYAKLIEQQTGLPVEVDHRLRDKRFTFVSYPMDLMDGMLLLAHRESLRYVADHNTLHLLPAEDP